MKTYKAEITFFYNADDSNDALGIVDNIADYVETAHEYGNELVKTGKIEAKVGKVEIEK